MTSTRNVCVMLTYSARVNAKRLSTLVAHHCIRSSASDLHHAKVTFLAAVKVMLARGKSTSLTTARRYASSNTGRKAGSADQMPDVPTARQITLAGKDTTIVSRSNIERLTRELEPLVKQPPKPTSNLRVTFGEQCWRLNDEGDAIYRPLAFPSMSIAKEAIAEIRKAGDALNHHASFANMTPDMSLPSHHLVICSTHSSRGLSLRDMRLAREVDKVLSGYNVYASPLTLLKSSDLIEDQSGDLEQASESKTQAEDSARDEIANVRRRVQSTVRTVVDRDTSQSFTRAPT
jgi:pterin-4a-carbinolamine dehydratase